MEYSEQLGELLKALAAAQGELRNPVKDRAATVQTRAGRTFAYSYVDLASLLAEVRPVLSKHGLSVTQWLDSAEPQFIKVVLWLGHSSGQWMSSTFQWPATDLDIQAVGSAITYLRRYGISAMLGIAGEADDDGQAAIHRGADSADAKGKRNSRQYQTMISATQGMRKHVGDDIYYPILKAAGYAHASEIKNLEEARVLYWQMQNAKLKAGQAAVGASSATPTPSPGATRLTSNSTASGSAQPGSSANPTMPGRTTPTSSSTNFKQKPF